MPANVGEMFYTGAVPWHGLGVALALPANIDEALRVGGLDWRVDAAPLLTADDPPSPVHQRKAIVRSDLPAEQLLALATLDSIPVPLINHEI